MFRGWEKSTDTLQCCLHLFRKESLNSLCCAFEVHDSVLERCYSKLGEPRPLQRKGENRIPESVSGSKKKESLLRPQDSFPLFPSLFPQRYNLFFLVLIIYVALLLAFLSTGNLPTDLM